MSAGATRRIALVTGASEGIGAAIAEELARRGMDVIAVARSEPRLRDHCARLEARYGIAARPLPLDLTDHDAAGRIAAEVARDGRALDILVANAGAGEYGSFVEIPWERSESLIALNVVSTAALLRALLPDMLAQRRGRVLVVASTAGWRPGPGNAIYAATKAFGVSFGLALAAELAGSGVSVTTLCPGVTVTDFARKARKRYPGGMAGMRGARPERVARSAVEALEAGRVLAIPGLVNRALVMASRSLPMPLVLRLTRAHHR